MSGTSHYSHTALSGVLSGGRLPSQELTVAFVRACGGDEEAWRERWRRERERLHGPPVPPPDLITSGESSADDQGSGRRRWMLPVALLAVVVVLALTGAAIAGVFTVRSPGESRSAAAPSPAAPSGGAPSLAAAEMLGLRPS